MKLIGIAKCMALGNAVFVGGLLYSDINGCTTVAMGDISSHRAASSKALTGGSVLLCRHINGCTTLATGDISTPPRRKHRAYTKALMGDSVLLCGNFDAKIRHFFVDGVSGVRERSGFRSIA